MDSKKYIKKYFCFFLVLSVLLAFCELSHAFCKIDSFHCFELTHNTEHTHTSHRCTDSENEHNDHARHYNCCDNEEPHDHPELSPIANSNNTDYNDNITETVSLIDGFTNSVTDFNAQKGKIFQRFEESYDLLICNNSVVLTI